MARIEWLRRRAAIVEQREFEARVSQATSENRAAFLTSMTHNLRTPLATIKTSLSALLASPEGPVEQRVQLLTNARTETDRLERLVTKVLEARATLEDGTTRPFSQRERIGALFVLMLGGIDTTWSTLGASLFHLGTHPEHLATLVERPEPDGLTREEIQGRNTWLVWTGGNDRFWDSITVSSFGLFDLLKVASSHPDKSMEHLNRSTRWTYLGLVNEPCFDKPTGPDPQRYGLWLDKRRADCPPDPFENEQRYPGVRIGARGKNIPLGRVGDADEIASLVSYLARPEAAYMNGSVIPIDGGRLA